MKLAFKLVFLFLLAAVLLTAGHAYLAIRQETESFHEETRADAERLAEALDDVLAERWRRGGYQAAVELIRTADGQHRRIRIRWVWFDATPEEPNCPAASPARLTSVVIDRHALIEDHGPDGKAYLHSYWPVSVDGGRNGGIELSRDLGDLKEKTRETILRTLGLLGSMLLAAALVAVAVGVHYIGRPLSKLIDKTRRIGDGDLSGPVSLESHDELEELADALNEMCDRLAASLAAVERETAARFEAVEQLRHADRLKTVGRLASGMAHELGTPLNVISGRAELIASGKLPPEKITQSAEAIKHQTARMTTLVRQLLDFSRQGTPHAARADLGQVLRETVELLQTLAGKRNVELRTAVKSEPAIAEVHAGQIQQVLTNLIVNAVEAMPEGGAVDVAIDRGRAEPPEGNNAAPGEYFRIDVRDRGPGIAEENLPHLFEPFFTTKPVGEGTGLGLSIAHRIIEEHGGWIGVDSRPGERTSFRVYLPAKQQL